jgi:hypothetical protein
MRYCRVRGSDGSLLLERFFFIHSKRKKRGLLSFYEAGTSILNTESYVLRREGGGEGLGRGSWESAHLTACRACGLRLFTYDLV